MTVSGGLMQHMQPQSYEYAGENMSVAAQSGSVAAARAHVSIVADFASWRHHDAGG